MSAKELAFLEGRLLFSQPKQIKKISKGSEWLEKNSLSKKQFDFGHVNS